MREVIQMGNRKFLFDETRLAFLIDFVKIVCGLLNGIAGGTATHAAATRREKCRQVRIAQAVSRDEGSVGVGDHVSLRGVRQGETGGRRIRLAARVHRQGTSLEPLTAAREGPQVCDSATRRM